MASFPPIPPSDPNITTILNTIKGNLELIGDDSITSLSADVELEIFRNYADEIKPSIFTNTDIGRVIDDHIRVLSYYQEAFRLLSSIPVTGSSSIVITTLTSGEKLFWKLFFNQEPVSTNLSDFFTVNYHQEISGIVVDADVDRVYFDPILNDVFYLKTWRLSWSAFGVGSFDVYYKLDDGEEVIFKSDQWSTYVVFPFFAGIQDFDTIQFIIKSHTDPSITCTKTFTDTMMDYDDEEILVTKDSDVTDYMTTSVNANDSKIVEIKNYNLASSWINGRDNFSLTISKELVDVRGIKFNEYTNQSISLTSLDNFRVTYSSVEYGSYADPNIVIIKFNRPINPRVAMEFTYTCLIAGTFQPITIDRTSVVGDTLTITINEAFRGYEFYRFSIVNFSDDFGYQVAQQTIEFANNHSLVYAGNNLVISDDNKIVISVIEDAPVPMVFLQDIDELRLDANIGNDLTLDQDLDFNDDASYDQTDPDWQTKKETWTTTGFPPIYNGSSGGFAGVFDGNGHTISNMKIASGGTFARTGLFGTITSDGAEIKNLGLLNVTTVGSFYTGALVGFVTKNLIVSKCYSTGSITGTSSVGGLIGRIDGDSNATVTDCYSTCTVVSTSDQAGGLIGYNYGTISNCYSTGLVNNGVDGFSIGGLIGIGGSSVTNCYWDLETSGIITSAGGTGKTTAEMKTQATYTNWDFVDTWQITSGNYPTLRN